MKQSEKKELAMMFSAEDWQRLCANGKFYMTLKNGTYEEAEVQAEILLASWNGLNGGPS